MVNVVVVDDIEVEVVVDVDVVGEKVVVATQLFAALGNNDSAYSKLVFWEASEINLVKPIFYKNGQCTKNGVIKYCLMIKKWSHKCNALVIV